MYDLTNFSVWVFPSVQLFVNSQPPLTREWHLYSSWCAPRRCFISLPSTRSMCQLIVVLWKHVMGKRSSQQFMWHRIMNINIGKTGKTIALVFVYRNLNFLFSTYPVDCIASCELERLHEGFINMLFTGICRFKYKNYSHN